MKRLIEQFTRKLVIGTMVFVMAFSGMSIPVIAAEKTDKSDQAVTTTETETTVYVTKSGKCYHTEGCSSLSKSKIAISLDKAVASYRACSKCNPPTSAATEVAPVTKAGKQTQNKNGKASVKDAVKSEQPAENTERQVWKSATGKKYHSKNNCGSMNPSKATQISESDAKAAGLGPCSKCW